MAFTSSLARSVTSPQARSQKFAIGGAVLGVCGQSPSRRRHEGLEAEPLALKNFAFFAKIT